MDVSTVFFLIFLAIGLLAIGLSALVSRSARQQIEDQKHQVVELLAEMESTVEDETASSGGRVGSDDGDDGDEPSD